MGEKLTLAAWFAANADLDRLDRELLAAQVCQMDRAGVISRPETPLPPERRRALDVLAERLRQGEPLAYLLGAKEFFGLAFKVNASVLVPRPETELLVEAVLEKAALGARVLDLGTGSGCVAIALKVRRPDLSVTGADLSVAALAVAAENAASHGAEIEWLQSDWLQAVPNGFDLIAANPPYVAACDPALSALRFEPRQALASGSDGLDAINAIVTQAAERLPAGAWLCLEHGHDQAPAVVAQLRTHGYRDIATQRDLAGHPRTTSARKCWSQCGPPFPRGPALVQSGPCGLGREAIDAALLQ